MEIQELLNDKSLNAKAKTEVLSQWFIQNSKKVNDVIDLAKASKDPIKATCIEGMEFATKVDPNISTLEWFAFVSDTLTEKAPRIKWESAKLIGNIAHLYSKHLDKAIVNLLVNSEHTGTVVRWSAAYALGQIIQIKTIQTKDLISALESISKNEEKNSIKKIYNAALKNLS